MSTTYEDTPNKLDPVHQLQLELLAQLTGLSPMALIAQSVEATFLKQAHTEKTLKQLLKTSLSHYIATGEFPLLPPQAVSAPTGIRAIPLDPEDEDTV